MSDGRRFYEAEAAGARRSAPAALRNREPIARIRSDMMFGRSLALSSEAA